VHATGIAAIAAYQAGGYFERGRTTIEGWLRTNSAS